MKILWITDQLPNSEWTAGQVMLDAYSLIESQVDVSFIVISDESFAYNIPQQVAEKTLRIIRLPREFHPKPRILKYLHYGLIRLSWISLKKRVFRLTDEEAFDLIIVTLQNQFSYELAFDFVKRSYPLSTVVWDPPIWWLSSKRFPSIHQKRLKTLEIEIYSKGFHMFPSSDFALSRGLNHHSFGLVNPILNHSIREPVLRDDLVTLFFAGTLYADSECEWLISQLNTLGWKIGKRQISMVCFGRNFGIESGLKINYRGFTMRENLIFQASGHHIGVLPYFCDPRLKEVALYSMPSKLGIYCAAQLPSLFIGPKYGATHRIVSSVGVSVNPESGSREFQESLLKLIEEYDEMKSKTAVVLQEYFSQSAMTSTLSKLFRYYGSQFELRDQASPAAQNLGCEYAFPPVETVWLVSILRNVTNTYVKLRHLLSLRNIRSRIKRFSIGWPLGLAITLSYWTIRLYLNLCSFADKIFGRR